MGSGLTSVREFAVASSDAACTGSMAQGVRSGTYQGSKEPRRWRSLSVLLQRSSRSRSSFVAVASLSSAHCCCPRVYSNKKKAVVVAGEAAVAAAVVAVAENIRILLRES